MGVGHGAPSSASLVAEASVRYPTAGSSAHAEAQPFYVNSPYGIVFAHNGNLVNTPHLRYYLDHYGHRHINTDSDSELLLNLLADNLQKTGKFRIDADDIFRAVSEVMHQCHGAYACAAMLAGFGLIAWRDPNGIRPLGYARRPAAEGLPVSPGVMREGDDGVPMDYIISSESVSADALGFTRFTDIAPGSCVIITRSAGVQIRQCLPQRTFAPDIFEFVYFARPDSVLDGISVYRSRMAMGDALGAQLNKLALDIDVVIPVPDTSRVAALQVAQVMQKPYREGFVKNRCVDRGPGRADPAATSDGRSSCPGSRCVGRTSAASSTPWRSSSTARTSSSSTTRSSAARPPKRLSSWLATPAPRRSSSPAAPRRSAFPTSTVSTVRRCFDRRR